MTENEQIIVNTVESLKRELQEKGKLTIELNLFDDCEIFDGVFETITCSYIRTEWDEGIYYHLQTDRLFFYGESPAFSRGGRKFAVLIDQNLIHLVPEAYPDMLLDVAINGLTITLYLEQGA